MLRDERLQKVVAQVDGAPDRERVGGVGVGGAGQGTGTVHCLLSVGAT